MIKCVRRILRGTVVAAVVGAGAAAGVALVAVPTGASAAAPLVYVAMGDSYAAGPLILPMSDTFVCARSAINYAGLLARKLSVQTLRDVTCSSATTSNFASSQPGNVTGTAPPQYNALNPDTTLVTVGIGGNDVGLVTLAEKCINFLPAPLGKSCAAKYTAGGVDQYSQRIQAFANTYGTVIDRIHQLAPHARVLMVGYPTAIRNGGCFPVQPLLPRDATYIQAKIDELNSVMAAQSAAHNATYIDLRTSSVGHDACALPGTKWVEGLIPTSDAFPLHPNELSMQNATRVIYGVLTH
jgi:lysophospholipase L1-like esterase